MKKSIVTLGLFTFILSTTLTMTEARASSLKLNQNFEILILENTEFLSDPSSSSHDGNKKDDTPPKTEPTLLDKIKDWWDSL